jgi:hypothetical protein
LPANRGDVSQSCGEGNKAQNLSNGVVGKTYTHHQSAQISPSPKTSDRLFFGTSSYGVGLRRSTSLIFWETVQPTVGQFWVHYWRSTPNGIKGLGIF